MAREKDNPCGTKGFAFVEFSATPQHQLGLLFEHLGFTLVGRHHEVPLFCYQQNDILFFLNETPNAFASNFVDAHGPSACGMGFLVDDAQQAYTHCLAQGANAYDKPVFHVPTIYGIGESLLYLVDAQGLQNMRGQFIWDEKAQANTTGVGLDFIDHLTHNVYQGEMDTWAQFYERLFNFREIRYFDIQGQQTGLLSRAMTSPCGNIRIPLNESKDPNSQIAEYLNEYKGEGIQHIALSTNQIYDSVETLRAKHINFLTIPDTYYELLDQRVPNHGQDKKRMHKNRILLDNDPAHPDALLLQIFTENLIGPIFFEIIERHGNEGFGEGNFQALFESMELDQIRRGVLSEKE